MDYITDLRHFLDERGEIPGVMPKKAREFAGFLALVVDECTLAESESESESAPNTSHVTGIACRERGCPGVVQAGLRTSDDRIRWACMICDGNGLISGWRGTRWDNIPESGSDGPRPDASATDAAATAASSATATATATDEDDEGPIEFRGPVKGSGPAAELFNVFLAEHPGGRFESMTELRALFADFIEESCLAPEPDFAGLSRGQVHDLLYNPFDSPETIRFATEIPADADAPVLTVLNAVVEQISADGLKPTGTGAFQRAFVHQVAPRIWNQAYELSEYDPSSIRREAQVGDLHRIRLILEMAGILQTSGGRFNIGREFRDRIENGGAHAVYPDIFRTYARQFNWAYGDEYPGLEEVQYFFGFSLYLLARFGNEERPVGFYADACARAFPTTMSDPELLVDRLKEPEERFRDVYSRRTFGDFLRLLGLVDIRATSGRANPETFVVRARLLLSDAVKFQVD